MSQRESVKVCTIFNTSSNLSGFGGIYQSQYFHVVPCLAVLAQFMEIHLLEALAILVAVRLWLGLCMQLFCDEAVVSVLTSGKVKDLLLAGILHEIQFVATLMDFELRAVHLPGKENHAADLLSCWHLSSDFQSVFVTSLCLHSFLK